MSPTEADLGVVTLSPGNCGAVTHGDLGHRECHRCLGTLCPAGTPRRWHQRAGCPTSNSCGGSHSPPGVGPPPPGPQKKEFQTDRRKFETAVSWHVPEQARIAAASPEHPLPTSQKSRALSSPGSRSSRASSHGFIHHALRVRGSRCRRRRRRATGRAAAPVCPQGPMSLLCSRVWGGRRQPPLQRGDSKRYSRSGCRSLCSLFLFLANSLSMAITSFSNSAGVGFASVVKTERGSKRTAPSCPEGPWSPR